MEIYYSNRFARGYRKLPLSIKKIAEEKEKIFRENPLDKRLKAHKLKGGLKNFWSFSISSNHRIIFEFISKKEIWFHLIGTHDIYKLWD